MKPGVVINWELIEALIGRRLDWRKMVNEADKFFEEHGHASDEIDTPDWNDPFWEEFYERERDGWVPLDKASDKLLSEAVRSGYIGQYLGVEMVKSSSTAFELVIIESPYSGDVKRNNVYLDRIIRHCIEQGEAPFASHRLYCGPLNDLEPEERDAGIKAGFAWRSVAFRTCVYQDYGISGGMQLGIDHARSINHPIEYRTIGVNKDDPVPPLVAPGPVRRVLRSVGEFLGFPT